MELPTMTSLPAATDVPFAKSFQPITVAGFTLKNRYVMGSMHTGLEEGQPDLSRLAAFYAERAAGGAALIVTGRFAG
jgi:2,4-dienoyl-CoA reductase (NADPH2)